MATSMRPKPPSAAPPRWQCQKCQRPLEINDAETSTSAASGPEAGPAGFGSSAYDRGDQAAGQLASSKLTTLDHSYVVLPNDSARPGPSAGVRATHGASPSSRRDTTVRPPSPGRAAASPRASAQESPARPLVPDRDRPAGLGSGGAAATAGRAPAPRSHAALSPGPQGVARGDSEPPAMEESFLVLPPQDQEAPTHHPGASKERQREEALPGERRVAGKGELGPSATLKSPVEKPGDSRRGSSNGGAAGGSCEGAPSAPDDGPARGSLYKRLTALERVFRLVSSQMEVALPLCLECAGSTCEEMAAQCKEAEADIAAYEAALSLLEEEGAERSPCSSADDFPEATAPGEQHERDGGDGHSSEGHLVDEEERALREKLSALLKERQAARRQLLELERQQEEINAEEDRYWTQVNDLMYRVAEHQSHREAVLARIEVYGAQLDSLRNVNVLNDAFHIWHDHEFGTISNFRLGRLPSVQVDWSEINAAWGQACHLLHTIAKMCNCQLSCQVIPMGSYPKIVQGKNQYELFGPVNLFWSARYDQAMVLFLRCLKELAEFAHNKDKAVHLPPEKCFQLPYKIQDDRVNDLTIKQSFNRDAAWTKALKYMLCNLKWLQVWVINRNHVQTQPSASS